jgi:flavin reductase (DIM6/NTAB) family NADH-FMN oxidoreductase RutF
MEDGVKIKLGAKNGLYPTPTTIVGANINGKPTYITIAHVGIMDDHTISVSMNKTHFTNYGIKENKTFSVNIPSIEMVKETDYCGLVSGKTTDKSGVFECFYGDLKTAPMIKKCPINMECRLVQIVDLPRHDVFVGEIVQTYCEDQVITEDVIDLSKVRPILFDMHKRSYWEIGKILAKAWDIGKELKKI